MIVYVDGNDMLSSLQRREGVRSGWARPDARTRLARWLDRYAERRGCDVTLIFDENPTGYALPPTETCGRVRVTNLEPGADALHAIAGPANRSAAQERVLVVTDDPRLAASLAKGRARTRESSQFVDQVRTSLRGGQEEGLDEPDEKFSGLSDEEVESWLQEFTEEGG